MEIKTTDEDLKKVIQEALKNACCPYAVDLKGSGSTPFEHAQDHVVVKKVRSFWSRTSYKIISVIILLIVLTALSRIDIFAKGLELLGDIF